MDLAMHWGNTAHWYKSCGSLGLHEETEKAKYTLLLRWIGIV